MNALLYVVFALVIIPMLVMAAFLLNGKGAFLIVGYNTMPAKEQARLDEKALCRSVGWLLIAVSACTAFVPVGLASGMLWVTYVGIALIFAITVGYLVYANTGNRFHKREAVGVPNAENVPTADTVSTVDAKDSSPTGTSKGIQIAVVVISVIVFAAIGIMLFFGAKEPVVNVLDNSVQIEAAYGLTVDFSAITSVSLVEESMDDLGVDVRTNGYELRGDLKGHFRSDSLGDILLFVQADSAPTIRITREDGEDIYLSFPDSEKTETLYQTLVAAGLPA
jgi:hypothetical protein